MRHLALTYPDDPRAVARDDEFLFGPDLLAAPVLSRGGATRTLYLPRGRWVDLWRSAGYDATRRRAALGARASCGGRAVHLPAPLDELPLLVRAGAVLPLLTPDVERSRATAGAASCACATARRLDGCSPCRAESRRGAWARGRLRARASAARTGALTFCGRRTRTYRLQASLATLRRPLRPCAVTVDGRALGRSRWRYDPAGQILRVRFRLRSRGRLEVLRRCR